MSRRQSGSTIISFALVAPLFFFVVFAISEGARIFNAWVIITNEAREAARYGAVHYDSTRDTAGQKKAVEDYLVQRLSGSLPADGFVQPMGAKVTPDGKVDVIVTYRVQLIIPMIAAVLPNPFPIQARSIMVGEPGS